MIAFCATSGASPRQVKHAAPALPKSRKTNTGYAVCYMLKICRVRSTPAAAPYLNAARRQVARTALARPPEMMRAYSLAKMKMTGLLSGGQDLSGLLWLTLWRRCVRRRAPTTKPSGRGSAPRLASASSTSASSSEPAQRVGRQAAYSLASFSNNSIVLFSFCAHCMHPLYSERVCRLLYLLYVCCLIR